MMPRLYPNAFIYWTTLFEEAFGTDARYTSNVMCDMSSYRVTVYAFI